MIMNNLKRTYQRSQILSYYELNEAQQAIATNELEEQAQDTDYVLWNDEPLPMSMFMVSSNNKYGIYSLSAFSAYFVYVSNTNEQATVVYAHC